ncbi:porin, partial [Acidithiobacillus ferrooxidans]|nr:porin [Acidithiobacillus ferrooxidans]
MNSFTTKKAPCTGSKRSLTILAVAVLSTLALVSDTAQAAPLPMPTMSGPLQTPSPFQFDAGPLGKLD